MKTNARDINTFTLNGERGSGLAGAVDSGLKMVEGSSLEAGAGWGLTEEVGLGLAGATGSGSEVGASWGSDMGAA